MLARWEGEFKMDAAKRLLSELVDDLESEKNLELGLRVYGHQHPKTENNCTDTRLEVEFSSGNHEQIKARLKAIKPKGTTPLAYSLERCANDFPEEPNVRNVIIIITDGIESCQGDPCKVSLALQKKNIFLKPFIIGLGMDKKYQDEFSCLGTFISGEDEASFKSALKTAINQSIKPSKIVLELMDEAGKPIETDLPVTFFNNFTGQTVEEIIHFLGPDGKPDPLSIDPVITYDLTISTIPSITKKNLQFVGGETRTIKVKAPTGYLSFKSEGFNAYKNLEVLIRKAGKSEFINVQHFKQKERYITGNYDIEILTLPRTVFKNVKITNHQTKTLTIKAPGILSILDGGKGVGAIYKMRKNKPDEWIMNFYSKGNFNLQPGRYKVVFRPEKAQGSRFTSVKTFTIRPQASTQIKLY